MVLAGAGVFALVGVAYGVVEFVLLAVAGATAFVAGLASAAWSWHRARRTLQVEVVRPHDELTVGRPAAAALVVAGPGGRSLAGLVIEEGGGWTVSYPGLPGTPLPPRAAAVVRAGDMATTKEIRSRPPRPVRRPLPVLEPGERVMFTVPVPTARRGLWSLAPRRVWSADPLGLCVLPVTASPPLHVVVCPTVGAGYAEPATAEGAGRSDVGLEAHGHTLRSRGGGDELAGLRAYVPGDRLNRIHWPALGRSGGLVVRDFVEPEARRLEVVVDDRPLVVDESVTRAAARALAAVHDGTVVDLVTHSGQCLTVSPGPSARTTVLEALAVVRPAGAGAR